MAKLPALEQTAAFLLICQSSFPTVRGRVRGKILLQVAAGVGGMGGGFDCTWCRSQVYLTPLSEKHPIFLDLEKVASCFGSSCSQLQAKFSSVRSLSRVRLFAPHGWQHARLPCPSATPETCSNSCPSSQ